MKPFKSSQRKFLFLICTTALSAALLAAEKIEHEKSNHPTRQTKPENQKTQKAKNMIKIEISGQKFNIPIEYTYSQTFEKSGRWPQPKTERINTQSINLSALLPDLRPYSETDDAIWKEPGHGERIEISIKSSRSPRNWFQIYKNRYIDGSNTFATKQADTHNLTRYSVRGMEDAYFPIDESIQLSISCDPQNPSRKNSPSCRAKSNHKPGIVIEYNYSSTHLPEWQRIDIKIKEMLENFEKSANQ